MDSTLSKDTPKVKTWLKDKLGVDYDALKHETKGTNWSQKCLDACKQQYKITMQLVDNLKNAGIEPNIMPPAGKWAGDLRLGRLPIPVLGR